MKILGLIPARYASTRFPGKPLVDILGKPMIQRVYEQASQSRLQGLYVATDDQRIAGAVLAFGGRVVLTSDAHPTGTDRCREAAQKIEESTGERFDAVINIQGDEPYIHPGQIDLLASAFERPGTEIATLVKHLHSAADAENPGIIKVVRNLQEQALYFSRNLVPHYRGTDPEEALLLHKYFKHIGMYGYRRDTLERIAALPQSPLEKAESLEQLRWLENGIPILALETHQQSRSVDTPADLEILIREQQHGNS